MAGDNMSGDETRKVHRRQEKALKRQQAQEQQYARQQAAQPRVDRAAGRESFNRNLIPTIPKHSQPLDPASASNDRISKEQKVQQDAALTEMIQRGADKGYDSAAAGRLAVKKGGTDANVYGDTDTELLLNSVGYTGNSVQDFNATVARVNKVFEETYGHPPTAGLVMDLLRSPTASSPAALRKLFSGNYSYDQTGSLPADVHRGTLPVTEADQLKTQRRAGLETAILASLGSGKDYLTAAVAAVSAQNRTADTVETLRGGFAKTGELAMVLAIGDQALGAVSQLEHSINALGIPPEKLYGNTVEENRRILGDAIDSATANAQGAQAFAGLALVKTSIKNGLDATSALQKSLIHQYHPKGLKVTGYLDDDWVKFLAKLSTSTSYSRSIVAQNAANAGFGESFDPFKAVDPVTGDWAKNEDGRRAKTAIEQWTNAMEGKQKAVENHPLWGNISESMPLQAFDRGGFSIGNLGGYIGGGFSSGNFNSWNPIDVAGSIANVAASIPSGAEHGIIRGTAVSFAGFTGAMQQAKTDLYAIEALSPVGFKALGAVPLDVHQNGDWDTRKHEAARRLIKEKPTWLMILTQDKQFSDEHAKIDFVSNIVGDILVFRKFGSVGETADTARITAAIRTGQVEDAVRLMTQSNYTSEGIGKSFKAFQEGNVGKGVEHLDSYMAGDFATEEKLYRGADGNWARRVDPSPDLGPVSDVLADDQRLFTPKSKRGGGAEDTPPPADTPPQPAPAAGGEEVPHYVAPEVQHVDVPEQVPAGVARVEGADLPQETPDIQAAVRSDFAPLGVKWSEEANTGRVGSSQLQEFQAGGERYIVLRNGVGVQKGEHTLEYGNEITAQIDAGVVRVKGTITHPRAYREGYASQNYGALFDWMKANGAYKLERDVTQTAAGRALWSKLALQVEKMTGGEWEYVPKGADSEFTARGFGEDIAHGDLGYIQRKGYEGAGYENASRATRKAAEARRSIGAEPPPAGEPVVAEGGGEKFTSIADAIRSGEMTPDEYKALVANDTVFRGRLFHTWFAPTVPARSTMFMQRIQRFGLKGRLPLYNLHPLAYTRGRTYEAVGGFFDYADKTFPTSAVPGGGYINHALRTLRTQFTKAANPRELPIMQMDPRNVWRLGMNAGLSARRAKKLEELFIRGRANGRAQDILYVKDELGKAFLKQGRDGASRGVDRAFSVAVDRSGEHALYTAADDIEQVQHALSNRAWAAISAQTKGMTEAQAAAATKRLEGHLRKMGFHPIHQEGHYGGDPEASFFVPGMTPSEAVQVGKEFGQESVATPNGVIGAAEKVLNDEGGLEANWLHGKYLPNEGTLFGKDAAHTGGYMLTKFGKHEVTWTPRVGPDQKAIKAEAAGEGSALQALPFGEVKQMSQEEWLNRALREASGDPEEQQVIGDLLDAVKEKKGQGILYQEEGLDRFSVPEGLLPRNKGVIGMLYKLNEAPQTFGRINRRMVLGTDPVLFEKHGVTDTLRRVLAEDNKFFRPSMNPLKMFRTFNNRASYKKLEKWLGEPGNEKLKGEFDQLHDLLKSGEYRYDIEGRGLTSPLSFWTHEGWADDISRKGRAGRLHAAAGYIDRRLMSGPYQEWKVRGSSGVQDWFRTPEGQKFAAAEGFAGENAHFLADMVSHNLDTIELSAPGFLAKAEEIRRGAKDVRDELAKFIKHNKIDIPVSGHVPADEFFSISRGLDSASNYMVGKYLFFNKWNRAGLFQDMSGRMFADLRKAGVADDDAFHTAIGVAKVVNRYHMLDLADALKIEQTFRWSAYFFTKHRLYWTWLFETMRRRPELAAIVADFDKTMQQHQDQFPGETPGTISFELPWTLPGTQPAGGKQFYTVPLARLLWLTESQGNPGMLSNFISSWANGDSLVPGQGTVEFSTIDSQVLTAIALVKFKMGSYTSSDDAIRLLGDAQSTRFRQVLARVQAGYIAEHGHPMDDAAATRTTLSHMLVTGLWRSTAWSGGYIEDPRFTNGQNEVWKQYNEESDPRKRTALREKYPWIESMIGLYATTPIQHTKSQKLWDRYSEIRAAHEARQDALLEDFQKTGHVSDLFGKKWREEGDLYGKAIDNLKERATNAGATDWLAQWEHDPLANAHAQFAAALHRLYPSIGTKQIDKAFETARPSWVQEYRDTLAGLTNENIARLPYDQQQAARETRAFYYDMIQPWKGNTEPTKAEAVREKFFQDVYTPWQDGRSKWFEKINTANSDQKGRLYDGFRQWLDNQDKPVEVDGIKFPSPVVAHFALLTRQDQMVYRRDQMTKQWGWLSSFDKKLLGGDPSPTVQAGWTYFNDQIYQFIGGPKGAIHQTGQSPTLDDAATLKFAKIVDGKYPGFYDDYVHGLQPTFLRVADYHIGGTRQSKETWDAYLGQVAQWWEYAAGPPKSDPVKLIDQNAIWRKTILQNLLSIGNRGVENGLPLARVPDDEYPKGGYFYQLAMAQHDETFKREFARWTKANPDFITLLFATGG